MDGEPKQNELSHWIWASKYRYGPDGARPELSVANTWDRVAAALAGVEQGAGIDWRAVFRRALDDFKFLPAGRILAGAGTARKMTLFNCFVMDFIDDSVDGIFEQLKRSALDDAVGRRNRLRLLDAATSRQPAAASRHYRIGPSLVHARLGRDVRDAAFDRRATRRDDGHAALRSSGYRGVCRCEARDEPR